MPWAYEITGQRFGKLVAVERAIASTGKSRGYWRVRCDCGVRTQARATELIRGRKRSCGCEEQKR